MKVKTMFECIRCGEDYPCEYAHTGIEELVVSSSCCPLDGEPAEWVKIGTEVIEE